LKRFKIGLKDGPVTLEEKKIRFWNAKESKCTDRKKFEKEDEQPSNNQSTKCEKDDRYIKLSCKFAEKVLEIDELVSSNRSLQESIKSLKKSNKSLQKQVNDLENVKREHEQRANKRKIAQRLLTAEQKIESLQGNIEKLKIEVQYYKDEAESKNKFMNSHLSIIADEILEKRNRRSSI
jgi:hypoxanthine phosphoribosyltransferase